MRVVGFGVLVGGKFVGWGDVRIGCCEEGSASFGGAPAEENDEEDGEDGE